ncbi:FtsQ-type POTRA domain-containing protein [Anaerococcus sp. AGMB00486]|uniref:FtsQ-type POTRA domain-containing protein n=2 Tax=Anaerococcus TaxID=165779 RepID=A0ABX2NB83_9FIRM|nr:MULTISPECIES: FtsQ-type POTRA domain-containing protein [Anaerococcus]MSS78223.1 FtsQ-type POTRA domain-containing protein [Anaerococcus porci]NVF11981.1 FtsQ-type POTRA domain-containing protein [Anaerococcus faecalis]
MEKRKRRKVKKKRKEKVFTSLFMIFLLIISFIVIIYNIFKNDYFKISQIYIEGNKILSDEEILSKLNNPIGNNIFFYDANKSIENLKKEEIIKDVDIQKEYPDKILINVKEEFAFMTATFNNKEYIISNESKVLDKTSNKNGLVVLKGIEKKPKLGEKFTDNKQVLGFIEKIQEYKYSLNLEEIDLENNQDIGIIINDIHINFGDLNNYDYKLKLLDSVLKDISDKGLKAYTIRLDKGKDPVVEVDKTSLDQDNEK